MADTPRRNPGGRPPLDRHDPSVKICVSMPSKEYDALYARARAARMSIPELVRRELDRVTPRRPDPSAR